MLPTPEKQSQLWTLPVLLFSGVAAFIAWRVVRSDVFEGVLALSAASFSVAVLRDGLISRKFWTQQGHVHRDNDDHFVVYWMVAFSWTCLAAFLLGIGLAALYYAR